MTTMNRASAFKSRAGAALLGVTLSLTAVGAWADGPGRGPTGTWEKGYLVFIIDHHYSALRMTELAAGTDPTRDAPVVNPAEGTSPTPGINSTPPKASSEQIRSMSRQANRTQREEIGRAQRMLRDWYGLTHEPKLTAEGSRMIAMLEGTPSGARFDEVFLRTFSNHHLSALAPSLHCQVKSDLSHDSLRRYCDDIVTSQKNGINDMREMLCKQFSDCDFLPETGDRRKDQDF
ncbi:DUF305 domain-containing protein [Massilia arenosa]|uniref:DUF305 domain-containing protein n=1 Tax=Zemynaea arenosa TaxID=2561931 RepID=A0A4Y9RVL9_9BURK|nr:DUF305 domain-containing protein [Massilia arenosa]TFW13347.1 DUF305 domain-containing protein [Massilia arenosa]